MVSNWFHSLKGGVSKIIFISIWIRNGLPLFEGYITDCYPGNSKHDFEIAVRFNV
jgi:hypothetical protein